MFNPCFIRGPIPNFKSYTFGSHPGRYSRFHMAAAFSLPRMCPVLGSQGGKMGHSTLGRYEVPSCKEGGDAKVSVRQVDAALELAKTSRPTLASL